MKSIGAPTPMSGGLERRMERVTHLLPTRDGWTASWCSCNSKLDGLAREAAYVHAIGDWLSTRHGVAARRRVVTGHAEDLSLRDGIRSAPQAVSPSHATASAP
jgi:hypothetical protein